MLLNITIIIFNNVECLLLKIILTILNSINILLLLKSHLITIDLYENQKSFINVLLEILEKSENDD